MDPIEARLMRLWARLAAENAALTALLAAGYALCEAEEILWEEAMVAVYRPPLAPLPEGNAEDRRFILQGPLSTSRSTPPV